MKRQPSAFVIGALLAGLGLMLAFEPAEARWEERANDLPAWAQRGRIIFLRHDGNQTPPAFDRWQPVLHLHGARNVNAAAVADRKARHVPMSLRLEATMFFGDDRAVRKVAARAFYGWTEHTWYWQYNWWVRDPGFRQAVLIKRDGQPMIEYWGNSMTEREAGNPLHPLLRRMRSEVSQAVLTPRPDPKSPSNPRYPKFPYGSNQYQKYDLDDVTFGRDETREYYPVFGHLSMLWYDNPVFWADSSEHSQAIWKEHFREKFGTPIPDPASHPNDLVRREWTRFWADAYGRYLSEYYACHQRNVAETAVPETTRALNGKLHVTVGMNASPVSSPWGAQYLYLFNHHAVSDFPGLLVEYYPLFTQGKFAPMIKFAMASMRGRPTGGATTNVLHEAEALALNGANAFTGVPPRAEAYLNFQYENRDLFTNALQGNTIGILYNTRTGLVTETLINAYELGLQLEELGLPYDVIVEDDLGPKNADFLRRYAAILVPGGEFSDAEAEGLKRYVRKGGHLILIGDAVIEPPQYLELEPGPPSAAPFRPDVPLGRVFGYDSFAEASTRFGKGTVTVCEDQVLTNGRLKMLLEPEFPATFRLLDPKQSLITVNALRQPGQGDARIVGLVNYTGEAQRDVAVALPERLKFSAAAAISPDGGAVPLEVAKVDGTPVVTVPELYQYAALVFGKERIVEKALETVRPRSEELAKLREPLRKVGPSGPLASATRPDEVGAGQRLSRLRHGTLDSGAFIALDALGPRSVKIGQTFRIEMKILHTGTHYTKTATMEYWRLRLLNTATGEEVRTRPAGADEPIEGAGILALRDGKLVPMDYQAQELQGKALVAELAVESPGRYQAYVNYLYNNVFLQGDAGPRVEPAFSGDRPEAGWGYPGRPLKKLYLKHKLPRMVIDVK